MINISIKLIFLSKIIYKQDLEILSELLTDLYYQKINISLDELNLNFDIIKKIKNSFFDYDSIFNNIIDYKIHIIDVLNTLVDKDKIDKDSTFNLFYNFFVVNILKYSPKFHFFKYLKIDEDIDILNKNLIKIEKDCFLKNKKNIKFIEISTKDTKGEVYCRYHSDEFCN